MKTLLRLMFVLTGILSTIAVTGQNQNLTQYVCPGSNQTYWVSETTGSTYNWTVSGVGNTISSGQGTGNIAVIWTNTPGTYTLQVIEPDEHNCTSDPKVVTVTVYPLPTANTGTYGSVCDISPITLSNATAANYSSLLWTTSGTGGFSNTTILNPVYTPSAGDLNAGSVTLTLTALGLATGSPLGNVNCSQAVSTVTIILVKPPTASAGSNSSICAIPGSTITFSSATAQNYSTLQWSHNGSGILNNSNALNANYEFSAADFTNGQVTFTLTAIGNSPCLNAVSSFTVTLVQGPQLVVGGSTPVCEGSELNLTASITGATYSWTGPNGYISTLQNPIVSSTATLGMAGTYQVNVSAIPGGCPDTSGNITVTVNPKPVTSPITHY
jgi:hypothetical protein